jgi:hypothetical protein
VIPTALSTDLCPFAGGDGSNCLWVAGEEVPSLAAGLDDFFVIVEDGDGEFVGAQVGPDVFDRVQFGGIGWQVQERNVVGDDEGRGTVPSRAVENEDGVGADGDGAGDLGEVEVHRLGVGEGQHEACGNGPSGADGSEDVGPLVAGVAPGAGPCAAPGPDAGERALRADPCLILEPGLDRLVPCGFGDQCSYRFAEFFLNAS